MIDLEKAKKVFNEYVNEFDLENPTNKLKVVHTYGVVDYSKKLAKRINLSEEDSKLSELIALLHDIGRFEQAKFIDKIFDKADSLLFDHAQFGVKLLFEEGMIRKFIDDDSYDQIIYKAISNHNKLNIDSDGMTEKELLHTKLIRDNDKMDNFRVKLTESFKVLLGTDDLEKIENDTISKKIYNYYTNEQLVVTTDTETILDRWISYIAFIFDLNYKESLEILVEDDMINKMFDRINYKNEDTIKTIEEFKSVTQNYLNKRLK